MNNFEKVFPDSGSKKVLLINRMSDPSMWVVYIYKKILFFKKKLETYWFTNKEDAVKFAEEYGKKIQD